MKTLHGAAGAVFNLSIIVILTAPAACDNGGGGGEDTQEDLDAAQDDMQEGDFVTDGDMPDTEDVPPDVPPDAPTTTVNPVEIDDVLINPGMGFADFHFGGGSLTPEEYPPQTVAYFRWTWDQLEPSDGNFDFDRVDGVIEEARSRGESLAFRIMTVYEGSTPQWLLDMGVDSVAVGGDVFPDHNNATYLEYHERLVRAFGERYDGSLDVDHVDIGSVGCWGEWNTACCGGAEATCEGFFPTEDNQTMIIDWYFEYFPGTPLVMLVGGPVEYAASRGAGWRGDCYGDYGMFSATWNHMEDLYEQTAQDPVAGIAWQTAPVQFESCGVMQDWYDLGFDIDLILQKGLEWHMSVFNAKSSPVPEPWRPQVSEFLKRVGYRFVLTELTHTSEAAPGGSLLMASQWENRGVAPIYHPWPLAYRLRSASDEVAVQWTSAADLRDWLPGAQAAEDIVAVPAGTAAGSYSLDVGILTEDGARAHVQLAVEGVREDTWYPVSTVTILD